MSISMSFRSRSQLRGTYILCLFSRFLAYHTGSLPALCPAYIWVFSSISQPIPYSLPFYILFSYSAVILSLEFDFNRFLPPLSPPLLSYFIELLLRYHQPVSQSLPSLGLICLFPYLPCPCPSHCMNISCKSLYRCFSSTCCVAVIRPRFSPFLS